MVLANTSIHMVGGAPKNGSHRVSVTRVSHISPQDSPGSPGRSDPGSYPLTASALGSVVQENLCAPFKNEVSIPPALSFFQKQDPPGFEAKCSGSFASWSRTLRLGSLTWGSNHSLLWENLCNVIILQFVDRPLRDMGLECITSLPLLPVSLRFVL